MIAIKGMTMPKSCCEFHEDTGMVLHCPLYNSCDKRTTIKVNFKPIDCPLVEIVTCKDCKHWHDDGIMTTCDKNIGYGFPQDYFCADAERRE